MSKVLTGPRAVVSVDNQIVGIFESCTYGVNLGTEPIHVLGRDSASEIAVTSYEAVTINCNGFRVVGEGAHRLPKVPKLQDLRALGPVAISIRDRQTGEVIMNAYNCVPSSYNTGVNARQTSRLQVTYIGTHIDDEDGSQAESAGASDLP
jgi:hypothetical protein